jgi:chloramphenicol 3-O-phosphotransferase
MPKKIRLPSHLPTGSKYVIEDRGRMNGSLLIHRHVELPDGHRVELPARLVPIGVRVPSNLTRRRRVRRGARQ